MEFQPECVAGEMREYQLEGLKWLVARFDDGINTILADEMVRAVRTDALGHTCLLLLLVPAAGRHCSRSHPQICLLHSAATNRVDDGITAILA